MNRRSFLNTLTGGIGAGLLMKTETQLFAKTAMRKGSALDINMQYRRLGKTGIRISEVSMGGHLYPLERQYKYFSGQIVLPEGIDDSAEYADFYKVRTEQIACALDAGINFFDPTNDREVRSFATAVNKLGRRNDCYMCGDFIRGRYHAERNPDELRESIIQHINKTIRVLKTDRVDLMRVSTTRGMETAWTLDDLAVAVDAFQYLKKEGKARFFGISSHFPQYCMDAINRYDEIEFIVTPYSFAHSVAEQKLFPLCKKKDIGVITIKPFSGGSFFLPQEKAKKDERPFVSTPSGKIMNQLRQKWERESMTLAQANIKYILSNPNVTAAIPGMNSCEEILTNAMVSGQKMMGMHSGSELRRHAGVVHRSLPAHYQWLNRWNA